eukprot:1148391-Pelagomonas_calceolata.AAC.2
MGLVFGSSYCFTARAMTLTEKIPAAGKTVDARNGRDFQTSKLALIEAVGSGTGRKADRGACSGTISTGGGSWGIGSETETGSEAVKAVEAVGVAKAVRLAEMKLAVGP